MMVAPVRCTTLIFARAALNRPPRMASFALARLGYLRWL